VGPAGIHKRTLLELDTVQSRIFSFERVGAIVIPLMRAAPRTSDSTRIRRADCSALGASLEYG
jgi:hypothetical protein